MINDALIDAQSWVAEGHQVALATVVSAWGSAPRRAGAMMAVCNDGRFTGSVSGGCVEGDVLAAAQEVMADGQPRLLHFGVSTEQAWQAGLACGGDIRIYVEAVR